MPSAVSAGPQAKGVPRAGGELPATGLTRGPHVQDYSRIAFPNFVRPSTTQLGLLGEETGDADISDSAVAALSEARLVVELLARGHKVAKPVVDDDGVDLIVNYRTTVQVKCSRAPKQTPYRFYRFKVVRSYRPGHGAVDLAPHIDVLVFHGIADDLWWVIPADLVRGRKSIDVTPNRARNGRPSHLGRWLDAWHVFDGDSR